MGNERVQIERRNGIADRRQTQALTSAPNQNAPSSTTRQMQPERESIMQEKHSHNGCCDCDWHDNE